MTDFPNALPSGDKALGLDISWLKISCSNHMLVNDMIRFLRLTGQRDLITPDLRV